MSKRVAAAGVAALALVGLGVSATAAGAAAQQNPAPFTVAVYGDAPYGTSPTDTSEFQATPAFINSINADSSVSTVIHVGDIHSGKQFCTQGYDQSIYDLWTAYTKPLVYTPGDNEWSDCHKAAEGGGTYNPATGQIDYVLDPSTQQPVDYAKGNPVANLDLIRSIFFAQPGHTLGSGTLSVVSQADAYDPHHPTDAQYVENVMWVQNGVLFVTFNNPGGSNNDADPWYGTPSASAAQNQEAARRTQADLRWLRAAFDMAKSIGASSMVIAQQADMWDVTDSPAHQTNYESIISLIADRTKAFKKPVLLFTGDSHIYRSDNPFVQGAPCTGDAGVCASDAWAQHPYYNVPNIHRIVVHGSTFPLEWLKLTVTPGTDNGSTATSFGPFTWQRMPQP